MHGLLCNLADSDAFLTPDETTDDEETIEKEELLVEEEVSQIYSCMLTPHPHEGGLTVECRPTSQFWLNFL